MKLLTKAIETKAKKQYSLGADSNQMIVAKFFNPIGSWSWYLMNIDPNDSDYAWGIVKGFEVEEGSFSISELENIKLPMGMHVERDLYFTPLPAKELWEKLNRGEHV